MEFFVGNLIVAGLSDWGCVLIPTGLPAELIPQMFVPCLTTKVIIPALCRVVNCFQKIFPEKWKKQNKTPHRTVSHSVREHFLPRANVRRAALPPYRSGRFLRIQGFDLFKGQLWIFCNLFIRHSICEHLQSTLDSFILTHFFHCSAHNSRFFYQAGFLESKDFTSSTVNPENKAISS